MRINQPKTFMPKGSKTVKVAVPARGGKSAVDRPEAVCSRCRLDHAILVPASTKGPKVARHELRHYAGLSWLPRALRQWREGEGLKISAAARGLGVAASTWGHWETGLRFPTGTRLLELVDFTGLSLVELVCEHAKQCPLHQAAKYNAGYS